MNDVQYGICRHACLRNKLPRKRVPRLRPACKPLRNDLNTITGRVAGVDVSSLGEAGVVAERVAGSSLDEVGLVM